MATLHTSHPVMQGKVKVQAWSLVCHCHVIKVKEYM